MTERAIIVTQSAVPVLRRIPAGLAELAAYRELLGQMTITRLRVRYQQTWLGWAWGILQPLALLIFLWVAGSAVTGHQTLTVAYPLFILAGLSPWMFLATSLSTSASGMLSSRSLIAKVYFPREIVPLSYVFAALTDLAVATALTMVGLACAGQGVPASAIELLPICAILVAYATAISLLLSVAQIGFRDIAIGLPLLLQGMMLTTPVMYPLDAVPEHWSAVYMLNPLAVLVAGFRGALVGEQTVSAGQLVYAAVFGLVLLAIGYFAFKTIESDMIDEI